jgi:hypothetical protein
VAAFLLGAVVVAILKPWGWGGAGAVAVIPSPQNSVEPSLAASISPARGPSEGGFHGLDYDPAIFGIHEPAPTWGIWPAGYLVTFGFVIQLSGLDTPPSSGNPEASASPNGSLLPSASQLPRASQSDAPLWPERFDVPEGNHLFLIGVNMPNGYSLAGRDLLRLGADATYSSIPLTEMASPWPAHFAVVGIADASGRLVVWEPGVYRLELTFDPGGLSRPIEIHIGDEAMP